MSAPAEAVQRTPFAHKLAGPASQFAALNISLFVVLALMRVYEFVLVSSSHALPQDALMLLLEGVGYDVIILMVYAAVLLIPYLAVYLYSPKAARALYISVTLLALVTYLVLIQYFAVTFIPLGSDLFGYSWHDIQLTVKSSGGFGVLTVLSFLAFIGLALWLLLISRIPVPSYVVIPFYGLTVLCVIFVNSLAPKPNEYKLDSEYYLVSNKVGFFFSKSYVYLTSDRGNGDEVSAQEYPLLRNAIYDDVLGPYFNVGTAKPNFVFLIIEGLGRSFVGEGASYAGCTPFLDSLIQRSLYWENFLSTSGRTFAVLPSLFGSLPYGENGFMEMGYKMPAHLSLIRLLKEQGYYTSYYYGGNANFDLQDVFLERQQLDFLLDENQFGPEYRRSETSEGGFSWGYADGDLFKRSLELIDEKQKMPRLDIYLTLNTHEPFLPPNKQYYFKRFEERIRELSLSVQEQEIRRKYRHELASLLYVDDAIRYLLHEYQRRADYENTIFFITGDHRIIPIPPGTKIDRFHVPLIIYSKMLKGPQRFSSVSTHSDVTPTVLAFLEANYGMSFPHRAHWLGQGIDTATTFRNIHTMPLMRNKQELVDYLDEEYFLAGDQLFKLRNGLDIEEIDNDSIRIALQKKLDDFKRINRYVCSKNKLYPELQQRYDLVDSAREDSLFAALDSLKFNSDQLFQLARQEAFAGKHEEARTICRKLLRNSPNYHDVRTLLGRTYAWEKRYDEARPVYQEVMRRAPNYADAISALMDVEIWSDNYTHALALADKALDMFPSNEDILLRKAKALNYVGRNGEALKALDRLRAVNASNAEALELRKRLGQ
jgi:phosphoglycerol transferase MdoB-like AlkP superfamily enzyme/tetratricopeptide (TPR) repeat protein